MNGGRMRRPGDRRKGPGRRRYEQRGHKEKHFEQEIAEFTKVPRTGIRIGGGELQIRLLSPASACVAPEEIRKRLEQEITEATENLSSWRSPVSFSLPESLFVPFLPVQ